VPAVTENEKISPAGLSEVRVALGRFFHDLATPLSGVGLHLERAVRLVARGEDPTEALGVARRELERAFELFERGRDVLLSKDQGPGPYA
jgi:signal transduction histidine kinase